MSDKKVCASAFRKFWLNSYSARMHHIGDSVGCGFDKLAKEFRDGDWVLENARVFSSRAHALLSDLGERDADRSVAEYYEFCYRDKNSLFDPGAKIPVPSGLWSVTNSQIVGAKPVFVERCLWKRYLAKMFTWLYVKSLPVGVLAFATGILVSLDFGFASCYSMMCYSVVLMVVLFDIIERIWHVSDNVEFFGDIVYEGTSDWQTEDFSKAGIAKVATVYLRYLESRSFCLMNQSQRILALYLTAAYFRPFLRGRSPRAIIQSIVMSCWLVNSRNVRAYLTWGYDIPESESWYVVCAMFVNYLYFGCLKELRPEPDYGQSSALRGLGLPASDAASIEEIKGCASYVPLIQDADVTEDEARSICECEFSFIEPMLNEIYSEERIDRIIGLADSGLENLKEYFGMLAESHATR